VLRSGKIAARTAAEVEFQTPRSKFGSVAEWFKATVLKTVDGQLSVSSNLTASANSPYCLVAIADLNLALAF
jgi:hypothetical protein